MWQQVTNKILSFGIKILSKCVFTALLPCLQPHQPSIITSHRNKRERINFSSPINITDKCSVQTQENNIFISKYYEEKIKIYKCNE